MQDKEENLQICFKNYLSGIANIEFLCFNQRKKLGGN